MYPISGMVYLSRVPCSGRTLGSLHGVSIYTCRADGTPDVMQDSRVELVCFRIVLLLVVRICPGVVAPNIYLNTINI